MEFCNLVFCYNNDSGFVNETAKIPSTNQCGSCSCENEELPKIDECCVCNRDKEKESSKKHNKSYTCLCEAGKEYPKKIVNIPQLHKATSTYKSQDFNCLCKISQEQKATITDKSHRFDCDCYYKNNQTNIIAVRDSEVSNQPKSDICAKRLKPCNCNCLCFDQAQTPNKESKISKDKQLSTAILNPVVCTNPNKTSEMSQKLTSFSRSEAKTPVNPTSKFTNTNNVRRVCFCPESVDAKNIPERDITSKSSKDEPREMNGLSGEEYLIPTHESQSLHETTRYLIKQSNGTSTRSTVETRSKISQISTNVIQNVLVSSSTTELQPRISLKPQTVHAHRNCVKSSNDISVASPDQRKAVKSCQTKNYSTNSADGSIEGLEISSGQSPKKILIESEIEKLSIKTSKGTITKKETLTKSTGVQETEVTTTICQCCQAICKSPSAPCVGVNRFTPLQSTSTKSKSTETVEPERITTTQTKTSLVESGGDEQKAVQKEGEEENVEKTLNENDKAKKKSDDDFCDLQEVLARHNRLSSIRKIKPTKKRVVCKEISLTKEDLDIIDEYFKDRDDDEEDSSSKGSFKYHYLMKDMPCANIKVEDVKLLGGNGHLECNFLMFDAETNSAPPRRVPAKDKLVSSQESKIGKQRRKSGRSISLLESVVELRIPELSESNKDEEVILETEQEVDKSDPEEKGRRETYYSDQSERISINDLKRLNRGSEQHEEFEKMDLPEGEREREGHPNDASWMGRNEGLKENLESYGSLESMVVDKITPEEPYHLGGSKEPVSVFEEILDEEKRKLTRSSLASQRSGQSKNRDRGSSRFFDFFRGWMKYKTDIKSKQSNGKQKKNITIRDTDEEIVSKSSSETSLYNYEQGKDGQKRKSLSAYRSRPYPNLAPRQPDGIYTGGF